MLQLVRQVFKDPEDKTDLALIFANQVNMEQSALRTLTFKDLSLRPL